MDRHFVKASPAVLFGALALALGCHESTTAPPPHTISGFVATSLVADAAGLGATAVDTNLRNPWGLAFSTSGTAWVSDERSGKSTLYHADGTILSLVVAIPSNGAAAGGAPTGIVFNTTPSFLIPASTKALWIFSEDDGTISAWNASTGSSAKLVASRTASGAVYMGLAEASSGGANFLYATNFKGGGVDVFDSAYTYVKTFTDPGIPSGYAPFGIANVGGQLYVTFARQASPADTASVAGGGTGYVDIFTPAGTLVRRFASNGVLNAPWGVAQAPAAFGAVAGHILVANFGDGRISAYDTTGAFMGQLADSTGAAIAIDGLWALSVDPALTTPAVFFTAGPGGGAQGLYGKLTPH